MKKRVRRKPCKSERRRQVKIKLKQLPRLTAFLMEFRKYKSMPGGNEASWNDLFPILNERTSTTSFDTHYFYQDIWAFRKILESGVKEHVDVGSKVDYIGFLSTITSVTFIDIRPLVTDLPGINSRAGSILDMPYADKTVNSLSCLHVAEHIGLGRYGDPLDPLGTKKSCAELSRVLAPGGSLYFGLPIGRPRVCFNAHRVHSTEQILEYFKGLALAEFSLVDDKGRFHQNTGTERAKDLKYGCGLFHFRK